MDSRKPLTAGEIEELRRIAALEEPTLADLANVASQLDRIVAMLDDTDTALVLNADGSVSPLLTSPPDEEVREAVELPEYLDADKAVDLGTGTPLDLFIQQNEPAGNTQKWRAQLSSVLAWVALRAVQAPRLAAEQVEALRNIPYDLVADEHGEFAPPQWVLDTRAAFPEAFGSGEGE